MRNSPADDEKLLLRNARLVLPHAVAEGMSLLVEGGRVARLREDGGASERGGARVIDLGGLTVYPGLRDLHIHGSIGVDLMEATAGDLHRVARFLAASGVTTWVPTLVPGPVEEYRRAVAAIEELMRSQDSQPAAARAAGVHYEGPFVNERQ